jgi:glycosyltransferase involved in cell wall biosynthesis
VNPQTVTAPKILIVHAGRELIFARRDCDILSRRYPTETFGLTSVTQVPRLRRRMNDADIVIFWFVGRAAIWAMMVPPSRPKIVAIVGGYEAANEPDIDYGSARSPWRRAIVHRILNRSSRIIAVSAYTHQAVLNNYNIDPRVLILIHNAIDTGFFTPPASAEREQSVLTVACPGGWQIRVKRLDLLQAAAEKLPEVQFHVVGRVTDDVGRQFVEHAPKNVQFAGELSQGELREHYRRAAAYFQPSRLESFGAAVVEAMSCGCVPVVSPYGALPEVVGDAGFILDRLDPDHAADMLRRALAAPAEARQRARAWVVERFDTSIRAHKLYCLIDELMASP